MSLESEHEFWRTLGGGQGAACGEFAALAEFIGPPQAQVAPTDWRTVEQNIGLSLPSDYKNFVDIYGAGTICDVRISAPGYLGDFDQFNLLRRKYEQAIRTGASEYRPPIFPERLGLIAWGESSQMCTLGWRPAPVSDPDRWGVTISTPQPPWLSGISYRPGRSFSSFLLLIFQNPKRIARELYHDVWEGDVNSIPARQE